MLPILQFLKKKKTKKKQLRASVNILKILKSFESKSFSLLKKIVPLHELPLFLRDCLWKFFLPADFQPMKVTEVAQPGKLRQIQAFELRMNIIADATIDLLFTKNRVTHSVCVSQDLSLYLLFFFCSFVLASVIFFHLHAVLFYLCPLDSLFFRNSC